MQQKRRHVEDKHAFFFTLQRCVTGSLCSNYPYVLVAVTRVLVVDHLDLEVQAEETAGLLPGVGVVPAVILPISGVQVLEIFWPH